MVFLDNFTQKQPILGAKKWVSLSSNSSLSSLRKTCYTVITTITTITTEISTNIGWAPFEAPKRHFREPYVYNIKFQKAVVIVVLVVITV